MVPYALGKIFLSCIKEEEYGRIDLRENVRNALCGDRQADKDEGRSLECGMSRGWLQDFTFSVF